jgi:site-specific DNA recombinase
VCAAKGKAIHSRKLEKCSSRFAPAAQLDEIVWQDLCDVLLHPESISQALERAHGDHWLPQELQARRDNLHHAQASLENQIVRLTDAYLAKVIPLAEYQRRRTELETKLTGLQQLRQQLISHSEQHIKLKQLTNSIITFCSRIQQGLSQASFEQRRLLVELLIDRVIVTDDKVDIRYAIPLTPESETVRFCHLRSDYRYHLCAYG